jgi:ribose transport system permease protein
MTESKQAAVGHPPFGRSPLDEDSFTAFLGRQVRATPFWIFLFVAGLIVLFGLWVPNGTFLTTGNLFDIGGNASLYLMLAIGSTFILGMGAIDLSISSAVILSSVAAAKVMVATSGSSAQVAADHYPNLGWGITAGVFAGLGTGLAFGLVNGFLVAKLRVSSFVITLGTLGIGLGIAFVWTAGVNVPYVPTQFQDDFGVYRIWGQVPLVLVIALAVAALCAALLRLTNFGLRTLAIGSSEESARRAGVNVDLHTIAVFGLAGCLYGAAGVIDVGRNAGTAISAHQLDSLAAITAVVIGGTSLYGGVASIVGTTIAIFIPPILTNGLVQLQFDPFYQNIVIGIILIVAVWIDQIRRQLPTKSPRRAARRRVATAADEPRAEPEPDTEVVAKYARE